MSRRSTLVALVSAFGCLFVTSAAHADWSPAALVSASPTQQVDAGQSAAISRDGGYVAFAGDYAGASGIWRRNLKTGELELAAPDGARNPSISGDGRWVAFTSSDRLAPDDVNQLGDVYARDMSLAADAPRAFVLVSAVDGGTAGLTYTSGLGSGATAVARDAISIDGRSVVFTIQSPSNVAANAPTGQVAIRRVDRQRTILLSTTRDPETGAQTALPVPGGVTNGLVSSTAAISADGSTVAWLSGNVADQVPTLANETARRSTYANPGLLYAEPLWRRIPEADSPATRRISGGGDPANPACPAEGLETPRDPTAANPCNGPLDYSAPDINGSLNNPAAQDPVPHLSADGRFVAMLAAAPPHGPQLGLGGATANVYLVDMTPGLRRTAATQQLTTWASTEFSGSNRALTGEISGLAISPDATHVAFTTSRTTFPLSRPLFIDPAGNGSGDIELYDIDLRVGTLRRVTRAYDGWTAPPDRAPTTSPLGTTGPSYTANGRTLAFASGSPILFYGDGNAASDIFTSTWIDPPVGPGPPRSALSPLPQLPSPSPAWRISATARTRTDGRVTAQVVVPAAGKLTLNATSRIEQASTIRVRVGHGKRRHTVRRRITRVVTRTVASAKAQPHGSGLIDVPLRVTSPYRGRTRAKAGLPATLRITFASGTKRLQTTLPIRFHVRPAPAKPVRRPKTKSASPTHPVAESRSRP